MQRGPMKIPFVLARIVRGDLHRRAVATADLAAAMRGVAHKMGKNQRLSSRWSEFDLVVDHSVQIKWFTAAKFGSKYQRRALQFQRNQERYQFAGNGGMQAFDTFKNRAARRRHRASK
jgi:aconitase A